MSADLIRRIHETKFARTDLSSADLDGRFSGYASLFDEVDMSRDAVAPGAFGKALNAKGPAGIRMLFQHNPDQPVGTWNAIAEDGRGLRVEGTLALDTEKGREVHALLKAGAVDGLSIGFKTVRARTDAATGVRKILEADLWEISIVTFPMLPAARVDAVKSARMPTIREFERMLVREAGLTRSEARRATADGYAKLMPSRDVAITETKTVSGDAELAARIRNAARTLQTM